jgi:hypothetical protein
MIAGVLKGLYGGVLVNIRHCRLIEVVTNVALIIAKGFVACFVTPLGTSCCEINHFGIAPHNSSVLGYLFGSLVPWRADHIPRDLHNAILSIIARDFQKEDMSEYVGISSGGSSIFPTTIENPEFRPLEYLLVDGEFRDTHNRYKGLKTEPNSLYRPGEVKRICDPPIVPSSLGAHTSLTITARSQPDAPIIQLRFEISAKMFSLDFLQLHLSRFLVATAYSCDHDPRNPLSSRYDYVVPVSVEYDFPCPPLSMALTHKNREAQFLACSIGEWTGVSALFQGECCLDCAVEQALSLEYQVIIQS